jgi:hypothetical protein
MTKAQRPMTNSLPGTRLLRRVLATAVGSLVIGHSSFVMAATPGAAVVTVQPTRVADLVLLDHGFDAGLREGMVCRITRGPTEIAEVVLVALRPACSAALIVSVAARQSIRTGDSAAVKILKT